MCNNKNRNRSYNYKLLCIHKRYTHCNMRHPREEERETMSIRGIIQRRKKNTAVECLSICPGLGVRQRRC
jgi:hypothetical protein